MSALRVHACVAQPSGADPTAVGAEVWDALFEEAVLRLGPEQSEAIFGAPTRERILARWQAEGLRAEDARRCSQALRKAAFEEAEPGVAGVQGPPENDYGPPGLLAVLAEVLDYLATLAGRSGRAQFHVREASPDR